ncbi:hypothetical protein [Treponema sp. R80B11-R83G3]
MIYTAESILNALKKNSNLSFNKDFSTLDCPSPKTHDECNNDPSNCIRCKKRACKQPLNISLKEGGIPLIIINFRFMIRLKMNSGSIRIGFIYEDDNDLNKLIRHEFIEKKDLIVKTEKDFASLI